MTRFILSGPRRTFAAGTLAAGLLFFVGGGALPACQQGAQGDRCNLGLVQDSAASSPNGAAYNADECNSGLTCVVPTTCVIAICCPNSPPYSDPNCECLANPKAGCPCTVNPEDAGEDSGAGTIDSGSDSGGPVDSSTDSAPTPDGAKPPTDATAE